MNDSTTRFAAITVVCVHAFMPPNLTGRNYTRHFRRAVWTVARHGKKAATSFAWEAGRTTPHVSYARHCAAGEQCVPTAWRQPLSGTLMSVNSPAPPVAQSATSLTGLGGGQRGCVHATAELSAGSVSSLCARRTRPSGRRLCRARHHRGQTHSRRFSCAGLPTAHLMTGEKEAGQSCPSTSPVCSRSLAPPWCLR